MASFSKESVTIADRFTRNDEYVNTLFTGDSYKAIRLLPSSSVDLVYVDPPFFTNRSFQIGNKTAFEDVWPGGMAQYLSWIRSIFKELRRVLSACGSIYVHSDWHASHYNKIVLDSIFGYERLVNEIIWKRQSSHNDQTQGSLHFGRIHDTIFLYSKSGKYCWNREYEPYQEDYIKKQYSHVEKGTGRRYALGDLTGPGGASKGNPFYKFNGVERYWRYSKKKMCDLLEKNRIFLPNKGKVPYLKRYLDEMNGNQIQDIWLNKHVIPKSENYRYPTQKPFTLLERIIKTSSNENSIFLDPFCGSGVSVEVAEKLGRKWIAIDESEIAIETTRSRLIKNNIKYNIKHI